MTGVANKIDDTLKGQWVEALRGDKYKQGTGCLRMSNTEFCCLGVLADLINPDGWTNRAWESQDPVYLWQEAPGETLQDTFLPVGFLPEQSHLASLNDNGYTFAEMADWIEEHL